jgi:endonuclease V-like protein UPF0215 family
MSSDSNPKLIVEVDEENNVQSMQSLDRYTARDESYHTSDLKPRFLDIEDIQQKLGAGVKDPEERNKVIQKTIEEIWEDLTDMDYADIQALAESAAARAAELRHRIHAETEAVESGKVTEEDTLFDGQHHYYAGLLTLRANLARQAAQAFEERGKVPEQEDLQPDVLEQIRNLNNTLDQHREAIKIVLERKDPGTFGDKTSLYREASNLLGLGEDATRNYLLSNLDDEPQDEREWREHLDVQS